jgi:hypothetical protein
MNKLDLKLFFQNRFSDWLKDDIFEIYLFQSNNELFIESTLGIQKYKNSILVDYYSHNFTLDQSIEKNLTDLVNIEDDFFFLELDHLFKKEFIENELVVFLNSTSINYYYEKIMNPESDINENSWIFTYELISFVNSSNRLISFEYSESLKRFLKKVLPAFIYFDINESDLFSSIKDDSSILNELNASIDMNQYLKLIDDFFYSNFHEDFNKKVEIIVLSIFLFDKNSNLIKIKPKKFSKLRELEIDFLSDSFRKKLNKDFTLKIEFLKELDYLNYAINDIEIKIEFQKESNIKNEDIRFDIEEINKRITSSKFFNDYSEYKVYKNYLKNKRF